jgi:DNA modification methylase
VSVRIINADVFEGLRRLPDESVHCVVTSPPYWGLRDYGTAKWEGGDDPECDHSPEKRGGRFATPVSSNQASNSGSGSASRRDCPCGAKRIDHQLGLEPTLAGHIEAMVRVFREVRRVLRKDGTLWLNYGDCYATSVNGRSAADTKAAGNDDRTFRDKPFSTVGPISRIGKSGNKGNGGADHHFRVTADGILKPKDLCGVPWRVAFALQADGWWLRQDIIWSKPNPMPESIKDRCTKAHEYIFLMAKSQRYYYDADAIKQPAAPASFERLGQDVENQKGSDRVPGKTNGPMKAVYGGRNKHDGYGTRIHSGNEDSGGYLDAGVNRRSVWEVPTQPFSEAHFATFPPALIEPCIKAGTSERGCCAECGAPWVRDVKIYREKDPTRHTGRATVGCVDRCDADEPRTISRTETLGWLPSCKCPRDGIFDPIHCTVLDPFGGSGTTGLVADRLKRNAILIELNPTYAAMAERRIANDNPLFTDVSVA